MSKANSSAPSISRRSFLTVSGAAFALLLAPSGTRHVLAAAAVPATATKKKIPVGLELYSVRNELMRDLPKTLVTVAAMGYEVVEFYSP